MDEPGTQLEHVGVRSSVARLYRVLEIWGGSSESRNESVRRTEVDVDWTSSIGPEARLPTGPLHWHAGLTESVSAAINDALGRLIVESRLLLAFHAVNLRIRKVEQRSDAIPDLTRRLALVEAQLPTSNSVLNESEFSAQHDLADLEAIAVAALRNVDHPDGAVRISLESDPDLGGQYLALDVQISTSRSQFREARRRFLDELVRLMGSGKLSKVVVTLRRRD